MQILFYIINHINAATKIIYMNYTNYNQLQEEIDNLSEEDYDYYASLNLERIIIAIDDSLSDDVIDI